MPRSFDVVVVGLGAVGSAAAYHLARRGVHVVGLDQFTPPHTLGSSHGQSRIIREAYFEHPLYVPFVQRAYELWHELEEDTGRSLLRQTGGLMIGPPNGMLVHGAQRSAQIHHLRHEVLCADAVRRRFPALHPDEAMQAVWEPRAGVLVPEACVEAHLQMARRHGAHLQFNEPLTSWEADGDGVQVETTRERYRAQRLLLCAGAWMAALLTTLRLPLTVERQVLMWFTPQRDARLFHPDHCPIYAVEYAPDRMFYGFPDLGNGVKVARHHEGESTDPERVRRTVAPEEVTGMRDLLRRFLPAADGALQSTAVCLYTNTPDEHFVIDFHPAHPQVLLASPCSGHGFKFAAAIGEVLADLLIGGHRRFDLTPFRLGRWGAATEGPRLGR